MCVGLWFSPRAVPPFAWAVECVWDVGEHIPFWRLAHLWLLSSGIAVYLWLSSRPQGVFPSQLSGPVCRDATCMLLNHGLQGLVS